MMPPFVGCPRPGPGSASQCLSPLLLHRYALLLLPSPHIHLNGAKWGVLRKVEAGAASSSRPWLGPAPVAFAEPTPDPADQVPADHPSAEQPTPQGLSLQLPP